MQCAKLQGTHILEYRIKVLAQVSQVSVTLHNWQFGILHPIQVLLSNVYPLWHVLHVLAL